MRIATALCAILAVLIAAIIGLALWRPVLVSSVVWPVIEDQMLAAPFTGITARGVVEPNLFAIEATGVSTQPVVAAANRFISSLSVAQRERALFPVDDLEWRRWANIHISTRQGVGFLEMNPAQTDAAFGLLATSLSARGFQTSRNIMRLEGHLADLKDDHYQYGERRYWLTIMGEPSTNTPWGWQIDGHHLIINYFVLGDQVVMTPTFMGSEPVRATTGRFAGTEILASELDAGLAFVNSLNPQQRKAAVIASTKTGNNNRGELFQDNALVPYRGLRLNGLTAPQRERATALIQLYVGNMRDGHAASKMSEVLRHWDHTYFAWVGGTSNADVFYYRIHSPVLMIEYDHQNPVALDGPAQPTRDHVHTVVRTPNGNDYGKDLLRQHLLRHSHRNPGNL